MEKLAHTQNASDLFAALGQMFKPVEQLTALNIIDFDRTDEWALIEVKRVKNPYLLKIDFSHDTEIEKYYSATWDNPSEGGELYVTVEILEACIVDENDKETPVKLNDIMEARIESKIASYIEDNYYDEIYENEFDK